MFIAVCLQGGAVCMHQVPYSGIHFLKFNPRLFARLSLPKSKIRATPSEGVV